MFDLRLLMLTLLSCRTDPVKFDAGITDTALLRDADGDGYYNDEDCDDTNPMVTPDAIEICDGFDNNCDGQIDEGVLDTFYLDLDGDGFGDPELQIEACEAPSGYSSNGSDCDDSSAITYPGATEQCDNEDNDCDDVIDEDLQETWYADLDGDGYGDPESTVESCNPGSGYVADNTDCNDESAESYPGAPEVCDSLDNDCNDEIDEDVTTTWYLDQDNDGFGSDVSAIASCEPPSGYVQNSDDCDDINTFINPLGIEVCDLVDNDCNGLVDEPVSLDALTWYADTDADGFGDPMSTMVACYQPIGYVSDNTDCNDTQTLTYPGADEYCNGYDDNCDGTTDEDAALDALTWYGDTDADGFGDLNVTTLACYQPSGFVPDSTDCDDTRDLTNPGAFEFCNAIDDNCDGTIDEDSAVDAPTWYFDEDLDGFGNTNISTVTCYQPSGYIIDNTDCDDTRDLSNPDAEEYCNGYDDNCDGTIDEDASLDALIWYLDSDADGYGNAAISNVTCYQPNGYVLSNTDCDDARALSNPGASEYCNNIDDDCNSTVDDTYALDALTWFADADSDSYGNPSVSTPACTQPAGFVSGNTDCDDAVSTTYPGAQEYCNYVDDDCDNTIDEPGTIGLNTYFLDQDSDGFGNPIQTTNACVTPPGYVSDNTDCDDGTASTYPNAPEYCNGVDDDCDNSTDENSALDALTWHQDFDSDGFGNASETLVSCTQPNGYVSDDTDCDDTTGSTYPNAPEYCNGVDDDCNSISDDTYAVDALTWYQDSDTDSFGNASVSTPSCTQPNGFVADSSDCDDTSNSVYPAAPEYCNGIDDDCDNSTDESSALDALTWYIDTDSDGFGNPNLDTLACTQPNGYVSDNTDCDDGAASTYPNAPEYCNGVDDDCDNNTDENTALDALTWHQDLDSDGYGNVSNTLIACAQPNGYVLNSTDCDDTTGSTYPNAPEYCNGIDDDCNNTTDDTYALDALTWYQDSDTDSFGNASASTQSCSQPSGYVTNSSDCNDSSGSVYPGATEFCNGIDDDCDNAVDDNPANPNTYYRDIDGDGYGSTTTTQSCSQPNGYVTNSSDCNDGSSSIYPGASEYCNGVDDDCDSSIDENPVNPNTYYRDIDGDGYGSTTSTQSCSQPNGYVTNSSDCNDGSSSIYPGASEYCNGVDDDCDNSVDESAVNPSTFYRDIDGDGYGSSTSTQSCSQPNGYVSNNSDCNDGSSSINPGAAEQCNMSDNNCNGLIDENASCRKPIRRWYNASNGDHFYSESFSENPGSGYYIESNAAFYLYKNYAPGLSRLYRCRNNGLARWFLTTSSSCEGAPGWYNEGTIGFIAGGNYTNTSPLYRAYQSSSADHFYTLNFSEIANASSYVYEGVQGYAWSSNY